MSSSGHVSHSRALSWTTTGSLIILWSPSAFGELPSSLSPYRWVSNLHPRNFLGAPARRIAKKPPSRERKQAPASAVVATVSASLNADCDNDAAVYGTPRSRGDGGDADHRLEEVARPARK